MGDISSVFSFLASILSITLSIYHFLKDDDEYFFLSTIRSFFSFCKINSIIDLLFSGFVWEIFGHSFSQINWILVFRYINEKIPLLYSILGLLFWNISFFDILDIKTRFDSRKQNSIMLLFIFIEIIIFILITKFIEFTIYSYLGIIFNKNEEAMKLLKNTFWFLYANEINLIPLIINYSLDISLSLAFILKKIYLYYKHLKNIEKKRKERKELRTKIQLEKCQIIEANPNEEEFDFENYKIIFTKPRNIYNGNWKLFLDIDQNENKKFHIFEHKFFLSTPENREDYYIRQTNIGNCFLVASIISLINIPGILDYLFYFNDTNKDNYNDNDDYIYLYCYIRGIKKIIKIKNTFPYFKLEIDRLDYCKRCDLNSNISPIPFTVTKNGVLLGQALIKAFICINYLKKETLLSIGKNNKSKEILLTYDMQKVDISKNEIFFEDKNYKMSNIYDILDTGLNPEFPMNKFLGCISEEITNNNMTNEEKKIALQKMIKYLNFGGFIEVSTKTHSYCVQTYIQIKEGETNNYYFSIINPWRRGNGFKEEGFPSKYIEEIKSPHINNENEKKKIQIINENYTKTGHMILKDEILLEWFFF